MHLTIFCNSFISTIINDVFKSLYICAPFYFASWQFCLIFHPSFSLINRWTFIFRVWLPKYFPYIHIFIFAPLYFCEFNPFEKFANIKGHEHIRVLQYSKFMVIFTNKSNELWYFNIINITISIIEDNNLIFIWNDIRMYKYPYISSNILMRLLHLGTIQEIDSVY